MTHYKWFSTNLHNAHQKIYKLLSEKKKPNQIIVILMNKRGELSDTEGSLK